MLCNGSIPACGAVGVGSIPTFRFPYKLKKMIIRKGKITDLEKVHYFLNNIKEIRDFEEGEEYPISWVKNLLTSKKDNIVLIAENERGELIGFLISLLLCGVKEAVLNNLYIEENYRKKGIATMLLNKYEDELKKRKFIFSMSLVKTNNMKMQSFNEKNGYKKGDTFHFYYKWV